MKKTASALLGVILSLVLLEAGLRLGGFFLASMQEFKNLQSIKQKGVYRILCIGESTTQGQYPHLLEQVLNQRHSGVRFSVIDKGKSHTNTLFMLSRIGSYLDKYHPDMVVAMMGINDPGIKYYQDISESRTWIFRHCHVYRFGRILYMHFLKKLQKEDIYGSDAAKSDPKYDKGSPEAKGPPQHGDNLFEPPRSPQKIAFRLGQLYRAQGKSSQAETAFSKAIEINPRNDFAHVGLGRLYLKQGKSSQAEAAFNKAIEINPRNDFAHVGLGRLYLMQGKSSQAEAAFNKAIEINPRNDFAHVGLGRLYLMQGKSSQAEAAFNKAIEINPRNDFAYVGLGEFFRLQGKSSRAEAFFRKGWEIEKFNQAEAFLKEATELDPQNEYGYARLGKFYVRQGEFQQAENSFEKAIELNFLNLNNIFRLVELYRKQGKFSQAKQVLEKTIAHNPKSERLLGAMASLCEEMGKPELARDYARKANQSGLDDVVAVTVTNYRKLKEILDGKRVKLVCVQYPVCSLEPLKKIFEKDEGVVFVDNEHLFKTAVRKDGYKEYFRDMFGGDFGHCTRKGNMLIAQNIADVILREVFNKR